MPTLPRVPTMQDGLGARNAASTFDALNNALMLYMKLKDKQDEDKRWQQEQALKQSGLERQNRATDSQAKYYDALSSNMGEDNRRADEALNYKNTATTLDTYPHARISGDNPLIEHARKAGLLETGLTAEQTLPANRLPGAMGGMPQGPDAQAQPGSPTPLAAPQMPQGEPQYFKPAPQEATGAYTVNETDPAKLRGQEAAIKARTATADMLEAGRNDRATMSQSQRRESLHAQDWYKRASLDLRRQGLERELQLLDIAMTKERNSIPVDEFNMAMKLMESRYKDRGIAGVLAELQGDKPDMPTVPTLTPPGTRPGVAPHPGASATPHPAAPGLDPNRFSVVVH